VTVNEGWVLLDGKRVSHEVKKIDPWTLKRLDKSTPGHGLAWCSGNVLMSANEGELAKRLVETFWKAEKAKEQAQDQEEFDALITSGQAFRVAQVTAQYGCELLWARRFTDEEKGKYSDWFREIGVYSLPIAGLVKVERQAISDVVGARHSDCQFNGCDNQGWIVSKEEWDNIITLSNDINAKKEAATIQAEADKRADTQHKINSGYCFNCESWCNGDCGHYSNNPEVAMARESKAAATENNYGITD